MSNTIKRIGELIRTQKHCDTAEPIFLVQEKKRVYGVESGYTVDCVWIKDGQEADRIQTAGLNALEDRGGDLDGWEKLGYVDRWEFVTCCFTETAARCYINANKHRLNDPRVYVDSLHRNDEMIAVRAFLMEQGQ